MRISRRLSVLGVVCAFVILHVAAMASAAVITPVSQTRGVSASAEADSEAFRISCIQDPTIEAGYISAAGQP